MHVAIIFEMKS